MDIEKEKIKIEEKEVTKEKGRVEKEEKIEETKERENIDKEKEKEEEIRKQLSNLKKSVSSSPLKGRDEKREIEKLSYPEKIGALVSLSFEKGIEEATSIAISLEDPSLVDEFHDTLVDQYKERLLKEGIINGVSKKEKTGKNSLDIRLVALIIILAIAIFLMVIMILYS